jgi:HD-GYP domain-containing protein (c-di-GMP phosphodiesterase class II)
MIAHHAAIGRTLGEHPGLPDDVLDALAAAYERWDGRGWPGALGGDEIPVAAQLAPAAEFIEVANRVGGVEAARALARERRGRQFNPRISAVVEADGEALLSRLDAIVTWDAVIEAEPALAVVLSGERLDSALLAIGNFVDLKSPCFLGHSHAVADLAAAAAARIGLSDAETVTLRRAGLMHDLGRLGISNGILDKAAPLGVGEWERLRLQPDLTQRMLRQSEALAPLATIAGLHRERLDGSGYPRGVSGSGVSREARILGAADAYQAMREPRPHRPALSADDAAVELNREVRAGRLGAEAVEGVLGADGHRVPRRGAGPAGLTPREVEVLRLLARGLSNKEIAQRTRDHPEDRLQPRRAHLREGRRSDPRGRGPVRHAPRAAARRGAARGQPTCIARRFRSMTASVSRSSCEGLNITNSVQGSLLTGQCPGGV